MRLQHVHMTNYHLLNKCACLSSELRCIGNDMMTQRLHEQAGTVSIVPMHQWNTSTIEKIPSIAHEQLKPSTPEQAFYILWMMVLADLDPNNG